MPFKVKKLTPIRTDSLSDLGQSTLDLAKYVEDEFGEVAKSLLATEADHIWHTVPPKPRAGTTAYADGSNWNPGAGEGPYFFDSTNAWRSMKAPAGGGLADAPSDSTTYGRKNATWVNVLNLADGGNVTGTLTTNTQAPGDNSTKVATTAFVTAALGGMAAQTMVLLETVTLTGTSVHSTVSWAGYNHIKLLISNLSASSSVANFPYMQYHSNGAYQATSYVSGGSLMALNGTAWATPVSPPTIGICMYGGSTLDTTSIPEGVSIEAIIMNIASTTSRKYTKSEAAVHSAGTPYYGIAMGIWTGGNTAIDGMQMLLSGGASFVQGTMEIYGIK